MMTTEEINLVKNSWTMITPVSEAMGQRFYENLFATAPELRPLFKTNMKDQAMKLMFMISYLVHRLENTEELKAEIVKLAKRHNDYGAKESHYVILGNTLLHTLKEMLKNEWNVELEKAWNRAYTVISDLMIEAQQQN